jgi:hypothetical protein
MLIWIIRILFSQNDSSTVMHVQHLYCSGTLAHFRPWLSQLHSSFHSYLAFWSSSPPFSGFAHLYCQKQFIFPSTTTECFEITSCPNQGSSVWQLTCNLWSCNGITSIGIYTTVKIYFNNGISKWPGKQDMVMRLQFLTVVNINTHYGLLWQDSA